MANNLDILDGNSVAKVIKTTDNASVHTPHHNVDTLTTITNVVHVDDNSSTLSIDDGGGNISIDDGGNSITVDNGGTFAVQATIAAGATAIAKAEDVASADADVGVPAMMVRKATPANTSGTDGDYEFLQGSAGRLWVDASGVSLTVGSHAVTNAGTFAVQVDGSALTSLQLIDDVVYTDDTSTHATGTSKGALLMAAATPTDASVDANDIGAVAMTTDRQLNVRATVASGGIASGAIASGAIASGAIASGAVASGAFASGSIGSGAIASGAIAAGAIAAGATSIAANEDDASADLDRGVKVLAVRKATPANTSGTDGDYEFLQMSAGRIWASATIDAALPAGTNAIGKLASNTGVTIGAVEIAASQTLSTVSTVTAVTTLTGGGIAHDSADSGNPIKVGAKAITALSGTTLVTSADRADMQADLDGALIVRNGYCMGDVVNGKGTSTSTSVVSILSAPAASTFLYITDIVLVNTGSTTSLVTIQYDTAGTPTDLFYAINPAGGGSNMHFDPPLKVPTAAKDVGFKPASSSTTQYCSMIGFKSKA